MSIQVSTLSDTAEARNSAKVDRTAYLTQLLSLRASLASSVSWLTALRDQATARVQELAIPSTRDEVWRFTDLTALLQVAFQSVRPASTAVTDFQIEPFLLPEAAASRLVFVDGVYAPALSVVSALPAGVVVGNLATVAKAVKLEPYLGRQQGLEEVFTALNTASLTDAAVIFVPPHQVVETPIHLLFVATGDRAILTQPRCLAIAEAGSNLTLVEDFVALGESAYFTNAVTEIWVEGNAQVDHIRVQRESAKSFHISKTAVSQARDSRYICTAINFGGSLSRHNLEVSQTGEQTETTLNGLTVLSRDQVGDTHSTIAFSKPYGIANQVNKCIVGDRAHAVFNGKILVPQAAQLTNASQLSRNLLLSPKARVDTKPQLEITANNVKCAHGATVSQLEADEVFYLQSRGIDADRARQLLVYAFAAEVIDPISVTFLRDRLAAQLRTQQS